MEDFIRKIARLITDDPDIILESDEDIREYERQVRSGEMAPEEFNEYIRSLERRGEDTSRFNVTVEEVLSLYERFIDESGVSVPSTDLCNPSSNYEPEEWVSAVKGAKQRLASLLSDNVHFNLNLPRPMIYQIVDLTANAWVEDYKVQLWRTDLEAVQAGQNPNCYVPSGMGEMPEGVTIEDIIARYLAQAENNAQFARQRLEKILGLRPGEEVRHPERIEQEETYGSYPFEAWWGAGNDAIDAAVDRYTKDMVDSDKEAFRARVMEWLDSPGEKRMSELAEILRSFHHPSYNMLRMD